MRGDRSYESQCGALDEMVRELAAAPRGLRLRPVVTVAAEVGGAPTAEQDDDARLLKDVAAEIAGALASGASAIGAWLDSLNCKTTQKATESGAPDGTTTISTTMTVTCSPGGAPPTAATTTGDADMAQETTFARVGRRLDELVGDLDQRPARMLNGPRVSVSGTVVGAQPPGEEGDPDAVAIWGKVIIEVGKILAGAGAGAVISDWMDDDDPTGCTTTQSGTITTDADGTKTYTMSSETVCVSGPA
jgi:hypothetical protein